MSIDNQIHYARLDELKLDPMNPRLGRSNIGPSLTQSSIMDLMQDWTLEELAMSFVNSGFWVNEALLVVKEKLYGKDELVVVEGNRRLAALLFLEDAFKRKPASAKWAEVVKGVKMPDQLFKKIPYMLIDSRKDVDAFLGFRHVTGIKEWRPAEKAEYIAKLIDDRKLSYEEVRVKIGSKTETVRRNYISYRLLRQMEESEKISLKHVEEKFSVLYLSLRTAGAQKYLQIDIKADPSTARRPVPAKKMKHLENFALWLFGNEKKPPLFTDSRYVDEFGTILESQAAVEYLERNDTPNFESAYRFAGGDEPEILKLISTAADNVELALSKVHLYSKSSKIKKEVARFKADAEQLLRVFPDIEKQTVAE